MEYVKINKNNQLEYMQNPFRVVVSNPTDEMKKQLANMFGWLEKTETLQPEYDTEKEYLTFHYEEQDGKAVQVWEIHEIEQPIEQNE